MLKLCRVTKVKVLFLVLVFVFNFDLFKFSAAILEKGLFREGNHVIIVTSSFLKSWRKRTFGVLKLLPFDERFRNVPFSWCFSANKSLGVDGTPNSRNKAVL